MMADRLAMARLVNLSWWTRCAPSALRFRRGLNDPRAAQEAILHRTLARDADTAFLRTHRVDKACSPEEWRRRVPVRDWHELEPWLARVRCGEPRVLSGADVTRLVPTSGTRAGRKLVPYTSALLAEMQCAIGSWIAGLFKDRPLLLGGPAYWSISPVVPDELLSEASCGLPIGFEDDSAYVGGGLARWVERALAVPSAVRLVTDPEAFRYVTLRFLLETAELRLVSVWHPSFFELLLEAVARHWGALLRDLADGTLRPPTPLDPSVTAALTPRLHRCRRRAAALQRADPKRPGSLWPRLGLLSCWADGPATLPAQRLAQRLPGVPVEAKGLVATEAFVSLPFGGRRPAAVTSHVLELEDDRRRCRFLWQAEEGEVYTVVVTTGGGLHRYRLGDRVRVTGFLARTPCLEFLGRGGATSDLCGEKLADAFVARAVTSAFEPLGATPEFALLAPDPTADGTPGYTLYVEPSQTLARKPAGWSEVPVVLDRELARNPHWELCRRLGQLAPPRLFRVRAGGQAAYLERQSRRGRRLGDVKPAILSHEAGWSRWLDGDYVSQLSEKGSIEPEAHGTGGAVGGNR